MSDDIDHLDWELDEGWIPIEHGGWGKVTHFQIVPGSLSIALDDEEEKPMPRREFPVVPLMLVLAIPFWLLAGYGLYCLVRG